MSQLAEDQLAAFVDRILRLKAEADEIALDIKEIYAEAKATGFDKTRLGDVVTKVRKLEKDATGEAEKEALNDLYWAAWCRAKKLPHAHAYARDDEYDPETGEITEPQSAPQTAQAGQASDVSDVQSVPGIVGTAPVESVAAEISTPIQPEMAVLSAEPETASALGGDEEAQAELPARPIVMETTPFRPATRPHYHDAFPEILGKDFDTLVESIREEGVREPIIRMGDVILDGWARYNAARSLGIAYPVQDYSGSDPLLDVVQMQRRSRQFSAAQERNIAGKLAKAVPHRADEIMELFDLVEELAAAQ